MDVTKRAELRLACLQQACAHMHQRGADSEDVAAVARRFAAFVLDEPTRPVSPPEA